MTEEQAKELREAIIDFMKTPSHDVHDGPLDEMAKLCDKAKDGYGFYIFVYGSGSKGGRNEHLPIHAHVLTQINPDLDIGSFDASGDVLPKSGSDIIDADKKHPLPADVKNNIAEWAGQKSKLFPNKTNWEYVKDSFKTINPDLFI